MSCSEKKTKSLFGLFQKGASAPSSITAAEMLNAARAKAEAEAASTEAEMPVKVTTAPAYQYVSSWQRTEDADETEREVVVNANGVASKLQEILAAPDTEAAPEDVEPRCLSAAAAEKFKQALSPLPAVSPAAEPKPAPAATASPRFSERLKQHVEESLPLSITRSFPQNNSFGTE